MNKVDELAKIIETGLAEGGALYDIDFVALDNARTALAELVSLARPEEGTIAILRKAVDLVLEDWPEDHPTVEVWLRETRALLASQLHVSDNSK